MGLRRTALKLALISYAIHRGAAESFDVLWVSPEAYQLADTVIGKWNFKLCEVVKESAFEGRGQDGEERLKCGTAIWLQPQELSDGALVTITVPETSQESEYRLEMQDEFGNVFTSPIFELGFPSGDKTSNLAEPASDSTEFSVFRENPAGTPTGKVSGSSTNTWEMSKHSLTSKLSDSSRLAAPITTTINFPHIRAPSSSSTPPDVLVLRRVPIAAFAVPLSTVSGIIIVAGLLFLNNKRKLAKERRGELKTLILSKRIRDSEEYGSMKEVQPTMSVLSRKGYSGYYDASEPLPISFPRPEPEPRVVTHNPFAPMGNYSSSSTIFDDGLGYHYDEEPIVTRGKSLTDQYTAAGTKLRSEDHDQATPANPSGFLPARMSPVHVRSRSPKAIHSLPLPPALSALSMIDLGDAFHILSDEVKRS